MNIHNSVNISVFRYANIPFNFNYSNNVVMCKGQKLEKKTSLTYNFLYLVLYNYRCRGPP